VQQSPDDPRTVKQYAQLQKIKDKDPKEREANYYSKKVKGVIATQHCSSSRQI